MAIATILALILLFKRLEAGPAPPSISKRPCLEFMLPVSATAQNAEYNVVQVRNDIDATAWAVDVDTWSSPPSNKRVLRNFTISDTFNISVQLCIPPKGAKKNHLQIATHGLIFDKRYWDAAVDPSRYSYVDAALAAGYSILTYDRLGTGSSDKPDAGTIVQAPLQLEILRSITQMARRNELFKHTKDTKNPPLFKDSDVNFSKIIHVGHSFGSFLTSALLTSYGELSDAAIITGYILNPYFADLRFASFDPQYAPENNATLFGDRPQGYMVPSKKSNIQLGFFSTRSSASNGIGGFEPNLLDYAFSIRQTFSNTEVPSASQLNLEVATKFKGPLQLVVADCDYLVCRGDCTSVYNSTTYKTLYPKVKDEDFDIYIQQGTGHGLTMHRTAFLGYKATLDWLNKKGL